MLNLTTDDVASLDRVRSVLADEASRGTHLTTLWQEWGGILAQVDPTAHTDGLAVLAA